MEQTMSVPMDNASTPELIWLVLNIIAVFTSGLVVASALRDYRAFRSEQSPSRAKLIIIFVSGMHGFGKLLMALILMSIAVMVTHIPPNPAPAPEVPPLARAFIPWGLALLPVIIIAMCASNLWAKGYHQREYLARQRFRTVVRAPKRDTEEA